MSFLMSLVAPFGKKDRPPQLAVLQRIEQVIDRPYMKRCKLPNVDPATGVRHRVEPDHSLRKYRDVDEGAPNMGCLGMQLCPLFPNTDTPEQLESYVEVGMDVDVLKRGPHKYIRQSA